MRQRSNFERAVRILKKRKKLYLISHDTLNGLLLEMAEAARMLERERRKNVKQSFDGIDRGVAPPGTIPKLTDDAPPLAAFITPEDV